MADFGKRMAVDPAPRLDEGYDAAGQLLTEDGPFTSDTVRNIYQQDFGNWQGYHTEFLRELGPLCRCSACQASQSPTLDLQSASGPQPTA